MRHLEFKRQWRKKTDARLISVHQLLNGRLWYAALPVECDRNGPNFQFDRDQPQGLGLQPDLHHFEQPFDRLRGWTESILYFTMEQRKVAHLGGG